ncbi:hypothetical protein MARHY2519 [Marinobacter nauticus ATCC 49840]|nr:hypothetical protein MARHY2519 [Marinobacter nauticus ATCC 49840]
MPWLFCWDICFGVLALQQLKYLLGAGVGLSQN